MAIHVSNQSGHRKQNKSSSLKPTNWNSLGNHNGACPSDIPSSAAVELSLPLSQIVPYGGLVQPLPLVQKLGHLLLVIGKKLMLDQVLNALQNNPIHTFISFHKFYLTFWFIIISIIENCIDKKDEFEESSSYYRHTLYQWQYVNCLMTFQMFCNISHLVEHELF